MVFREDWQEYGALHLCIYHNGMDYPNFCKAASQNERKEVSLEMLE